ncbi:hypothetical protein [Listeria booriae]|uniref:Uncharacterized protein n=1 Tax=Listeria booriae TaxID=1552123 RepID=A0A7X1A987_9LIST|nr:hypothetical protein [Listeria booriae]MBC1228824.1 hypothetical protein [Listeria booriae]MBC1333468.1 hypothetical protein [Listeria booriae]MBC2373634.1 hypothetical protein [Listeria booriae]MBC2388773.1 hypothetical protein [Listeria booriae]
MFGLLALVTFAVACVLFFIAWRMIKNKKLESAICNLAVALLIPISIFMGLHVIGNQKEEQRQERKDITLYVKTEKLVDGESLIGLEYNKTKSHTVSTIKDVIFGKDSTFKVAFIVKNKGTDMEREEIIVVDGSDMNEVVSEIRENNSLRERLEKQRKQ